MLIEKYEKKSFVVIGKEGSTKDGADFINKLWVAQTLISAKFGIWQRKTQAAI